MTPAQRAEADRDAAAEVLRQAREASRTSAAHQTPLFEPPPTPIERAASESEPPPADAPAPAGGKLTLRRKLRKPK